jgi:hypothetical protein
MIHRQDILGFLRANWTATPIHALDEIMTLDDLPATAEEVQLLVDFPSAIESIRTIAVHDQNGWRQYGMFQLALANPIGADVNTVIGYATDLQRLLRGRRIANTVIEGVPTFSAEGLNDGKWQLWVSLPSFYRDEFQ